MSGHVSVPEVQAWVETTKMGDRFTALNDSLESQIAADVLAALSSNFTVTTWADSGTTPLLVRRVIAMRYVAWVYYQLVGDNDEGNAYADLLMLKSDELLAGIISGSIDLPDIPDGVNLGNSLPGYYPTDESSALCATSDDLSLGGPYFSMGKVW